MFENLIPKFLKSFIFKKLEIECYKELFAQVSDVDHGPPVYYEYGNPSILSMPYFLDESGQRTIFSIFRRNVRKVLVVLVVRSAIKTGCYGREKLL